MQLLPPRLLVIITIAYWTAIISLGAFLFLLYPSPLQYDGISGNADKDQEGGYIPPRLVERSEPKPVANPPEKSSPKEVAEATQVPTQTEEASSESSEIQSVSLNREDDSENPPSPRNETTAQVTKSQEPGLAPKPTNDSPVVQISEDIGFANKPTQIAQRIITGVNAPGYRLKDRDMIEYLVSKHAARFVLVDQSQIAFDLGKSLDKPQPRRINGDSWWKANYAERMLHIPMTRAGRASLARISEAFTSRKIRIEPNTSQLFLAIPHGLDFDIYQSQIDFMGAEFRADVFTVISIDDSGIIIHGVEDS
jgi:hypothetical protein